MDLNTKVQDVFEAVAQAANDVLGGHFCVVQPYDQATDKFLLDEFTAAGAPEAARYNWNWRQPREHGTARTALNQEVLIVEDYDQQVDKFPFLTKSPTGLKGAFRDVAEIKAFIGLRLEARGEKVGVLFINYPAPHRFTEQEQSLARLFAHQAAIAIRNARTYSKLRGLESIGQATSQELELKPLVRLILESIQNTLGFEFASVSLVDEERKVIQAMDAIWTVQSNYGEVWSQLSHYPLDHHDIQADIVRTGKTEIISAWDERFNRDIWEKFGHEKLLRIFLPLKIGDKVIGVVEAGYDKSRKQYIAEDETWLLQTFLNQAAIAIHNARLYGEMRTYAGITEQELNDVIRVAQEIMREASNPEVGLDQFVPYVIDRTLNLIDFDAGWLFWRQGHRVSVVAADRQNVDDVGRVFSIDDSIGGLSVLQRELIYIPDLSKMPEEYRRVYKAPRRSGAMRSELVVPLLVGDSAIGAFNIESERVDAFDTRQAEKLKLLANQVAVAIELTRIREQVQALRGVALDLSRELDTDKAFELILRHALKQVKDRFAAQEASDEHAPPTEFGQILLREETVLRVEATTNNPPLDKDQIYDIHGTISGLAVEHAKPILVPDVRKSDYFLVNSVDVTAGSRGELVLRSMATSLYKRALQRDKEEIVAEYAIPLYHDGQIIAVVNVETPRASGFSEAQRADLQALVNAQAARVAEALTQRSQDTLHNLLREMLARVDTKFGQILRVEDDELVIEQTTGGERVGTHVSVSASVTGRALCEGQAQYVPNVTEDPHYQRFLGEEMKSELAVPLIVGTKVIGVLNLESQTPDFFTLDHAHMLEALASDAALAIERAQKFKAHELAEIGGLAGDIVHRLNNPLGAISFRLDLFKQKAFYPELVRQQPDISQFMERTERDLKRAKEIIQELRNEMKDGRKRSHEPVEMDLEEAIEAALNDAGVYDKKHRIQVQMEVAPVKVMADSNLRKVFWNLFDNARKAMINGGTLTVTADVHSKERWVTVRVEDTGKGIEPYRLSRIFKPDHTGSETSYAPAHGLGLWWTKAAVESFGGDITVESSLDVGTCFRVNLRKAASSGSQDGTILIDE
jgi:GAF domain-containing protein